MYLFRELLLEKELIAATQLLATEGLDLPDNTDLAYGLFNGAELVATGFLAGTILCGICVNKAYRSEGLAAKMLSQLMQEGLSRGVQHFFIYTKPQEAHSFASLDFLLVGQSPYASLLEWGHPNCAEWLEQTRLRIAKTALGGNKCAAIVMNANPCTLGHVHLVEQARQQCETLLVFVVEEEASTFPFALRYKLVQMSTANIPGVIVLAGGPYMVSRASFPAYFTGKAEHANVYAQLDASLFAHTIAPALGIEKRFVGEEPFCAVTAAYNSVLRMVLEPSGVGFVCIPRLSVKAEAISASAVRRLLQQNTFTAWQSLQSLLPPHVYTFLQEDAQAQSLILSMPGKQGRH